VLYFWWIVVAAKFDIVRVSAQAAIAVWMATEVGLGILSLFRPGARSGHWSHVFAFLVGVAIAQSAGMRLKAIRDADYRLELARAAKEPLRAAGESETALAIVPADVEVQLQAARAWADLDDFEKAEGHLEEAARLAIKLDDRKSLVKVHEMARGIEGTVKLPPAESFAIANALLAAGRFSDAVARLDSVWQDHEEASEARIALLRAAEIRAEKLNDAEKGKELLQLFCEKYPDSEWLGYVRGKLDSLSK
jgi:tetratricopeptide (TPR) repeat protein